MQKISNIHCNCADPFTAYWTPYTKLADLGKCTFQWNVIFETSKALLWCVSLVVDQQHFRSNKNFL